MLVRIGSAPAFRSWLLGTQEPISADDLHRDYGEAIVSMWDYGVGDSAELAIVR